LDITKITKIDYYQVERSEIPFAGITKIDYYQNYQDCKITKIAKLPRLDITKIAKIGYYQNLLLPKLIKAGGNMRDNNYTNLLKLKQEEIKI